MEEESSFYVLLTSNASTEIHEDNTLSRFVNVFPSHLKLSGWKVALQSIAFDAVFNCFPPTVQINKTVIILWEKSKFTKYMQTHFGKQPPPRKRIRIPGPQRYHSVQQVFNNVKFQWGSKHKIDFSVTRAAGDEIGEKLTIRGAGYYMAVEENICKWVKFDTKKGVLYVYKDVRYFIFDLGESVSSEDFFTNTPARVAVELGEMKESLSGSSYNRILSTLPLDENKLCTSPSYYFEVKRKEYHLIQNHSIESLSILLKDADSGEQLNLLPGQATYVKLRFINPAKNMDSFMMRLTSSTSNTIYDENKNSNFRVRLGQAITLEGHWEVALTSIHFPPLFHMADFLPNDPFWFMLAKDGVDLGEVKVKRTNLTSFATLQKFMNTKFEEKISESGFELKIANKHAFLLNGTEHPVEIKISAALAGLFGSSNAGKEDSSTESYRINPTKTVLFHNEIKQIERVFPHSFLLYSDIITPIIVGSSKARVLKLVPITPNISSHYECTHLDFIRLSNNRLSHMHFELRLSDGRLLPFLDRKTDVILNLMFRKVK
jgi:hypothetical protein